MESHNKSLGRVKWFNHHKGYGFVTCLSEKYKDKDLFVHHTSLNVKDDVYKYLLEGEYVEFNVKKSYGKYEFETYDMTGLMGGMLMCENKNTQMYKIYKNFKNNKKH